MVHPAGPVIGDERVYYSARLRQLLPPGRPEILVRVDDYPREDFPTHRFFEFARILADHGVQPLVGVTPLLRRDRQVGLSDEEIRWLAEASAQGTAVIAVHGTTHENLARGRGRHATTELVGVPKERLRRSLQAGLSRLVGAGLPAPRHFIPPFNSVDAEAFLVLAETYRFVHGGPLSIDTLGPLSPGCALGPRDDQPGRWLPGAEPPNRSAAPRSPGRPAIYLPSYRPWYARAGELVDRVASYDRSGPRRRMPLVLTLHWAWEQADGMRGLRRLASVLVGRTGRWDRLEGTVADAHVAAR